MEVTTGLERYKAENPLNYTKVELAHKSKALKDMAKDYPNVPEVWLEYLYDWQHITPKEEVERIIESGEWEVPGKFSEFKNVNTH